MSTADFSSQANGSNTLGATPNRKRGKSMPFRSGQSGTVVRNGRCGTVGTTLTFPLRKSGVKLLHARKKAPATEAKGAEVHLGPLRTKTGLTPVCYADRRRLKMGCHYPYRG